MRARHVTAVLAALLLPVTAPAPAHAANYYVTMIGSGTVSPGLTMVPTFETVAFTADLALGVGDSGATVTATGCSFQGNSEVAATVSEEVTDGQFGGCAGTDVHGNVRYVRQLTAMTLHGNLYVHGHNHVIGASACVWWPTSLNPVTTFWLSCTFTLV